MNDKLLTWEQAVVWLRNQPEQAELVRACFYDDPILEAAQRFHAGSEWQAVQKLLGGSRGTVLEIGAGRGIASYALAKDGWQVTALEPDGSALVGYKAIESLSESAGLNIRIVGNWGESLPFADSAFDFIYGRAVLHHAKSLSQLCSEVYRVLKPGGRFLFVREHVISKPSDKAIFLQKHPLHRHYGGENAYLLREYLDYFKNAHLSVERCFNPCETDINLFPLTRKQLKKIIAAKIKLPISDLIPDAALSLLGRFDASPGRLFSFWGLKNVR